MKPLDLRANVGKDPTPGQQTGKCLQANKKPLSLMKPWNRWIYEPMGAKHQKLLLGNNAPGKCLREKIRPHTTFLQP